jgi:hypothetical protein
MVFLYYSIKRGYLDALLFILDSLKLLITNYTLVFAGSILTRAVVYLLTYLSTKLKHTLSRTGSVRKVNAPVYIIYGLTRAAVIIEVVKTSACMRRGFLASLTAI